MSKGRKKDAFIVVVWIGKEEYTNISQMLRSEKTVGVEEDEDRGEGGGEPGEGEETKKKKSRTTDVRCWTFSLFILSVYK